MAIFTGFLWDLISIATALLAISYAYYKWSYLYWKRRNVPYLEPTIPFGNLFNPLNRVESFSDLTKKIYAEAKSKGYKHCGLYILASPILFVLDLELAKLVMTNDTHNFIDRGVYTNEKDDPLSCHLFAISGQRWKNLRAKLTPTFTSGKMKAMFQTLVDCGLVLEKYIEDHAGAGSNEAVDIKEVLCCYTTDVIGSCAFGLDCNSFKEPDSPFRIFGKRILVQNATDALLGFFGLSFPNAARFLRMRALPKEATDFYKKTVEDTVAYREKNNYVRKDFLQLLIDIRNKEGQEGHKGDGKVLTMDEISAQSFVFFLAGFETSSSTMTFALYELARHQEIQEKLRKEISTILAKHDGQITYDSLSEMKYMSQVIDETLRMYPPLPVLARKAERDYKIPGEDIIIEKGTQLFIPIIAYQHDEEYFSNPEVFDPDRFSAENKHKIRQYSNMPFGEGPRICIGERFGVMQTKVGLASILRKFKVTLNSKTDTPLKMNPKSFFLNVEGGIWLNIEAL